MLDRDRIVDAAMQAIEAEGDLVVSSLARRLGVHPSSLYHHVKSRDEVVEMVRHRVVSSMDVDSLDRLPWPDGILTWARSYVAAFAAHPGTVRVLATTTVRDSQTLAMYECLVRALERAGFRREDALPIMTGIESFLLGSALDMAAPPTMILVESEEAHPHLRAALAAMPDTAERAETAFELGLAALLGDIESRRTMRS